MINPIIESIILSLLPISELRGGIPLAVYRGISIYSAFLICVAANFFVIPFVFFFLVEQKTVQCNHRFFLVCFQIKAEYLKKQFVDEFASLGKNKFLFDDAEGLIKTRNITTPLKQINLPYYADLEVGKAINGKYTTEAMADALKNMSLFTDSWITNPYYRGFLAMKSYAQIAKTVLSPITQVRNVTSAAGFAFANGHVGGGASLREAVDYFLKDLFSMYIFR